MILSIFASVLTGIGGHYLNRRWDKAIFFLCLFVLNLAAAYGYLAYSVNNLSTPSDEMMQEIIRIYSLVNKVSVAGMVLLWLTSVCVTFIDSRGVAQPTIARWTKPGLTGAFLTSLLPCLLLAFSLTNYLSSPAIQSDDGAFSAGESDSFGSSPQLADL